MERIAMAFEPPGPPSPAVVDMAAELSQGLGAEVLVVCAVEWHPRYGGMELEPARRALDEAVQRLGTMGVRARGQLTVALAGDGPRVLAEDVTHFGAGLLIVDDRRTLRLLRALGLGFARRLAGAARLPVLLLPEGRPRRHRLPA